MVKNRFYKSLPNSNMLAYIGKAIAYTTDATFALFVANAPDGEIGLYNADTFALIPGIVTATPTIMTAGTRFFIAAMRGTQVETSDVMTFGAGNTSITQYAYQAPAKAVWTIVTSGTLAANDILEVSIIDQTTAFTPYPVQRYQYVVPAAGATLTAGITALAAIINNTTLPPNRGGNKLATAAVVSTDDLQITADYFGSNIKVMTGYKLSEIGTTTNGTKMNIGSGTPEQVREYELSSDIMKGATHVYNNGMVTYQPAELGLPVDEITSGGQYVTFQFIFEAQEWNPTPVEKHFKKRQVLLFVQDSTTDPIANLTGAFFGT